MRPPAPMPPKSPRVGFAELIDQAIQARPAHQNTAEHALSVGVDPQMLVDYARGDRTPAVKSAGKVMVLDSPWAMRRVVALIRASRNPDTLAAGILRTSGRTNPYEWGISRTEDPDMDFARLLEQIE
jgi:hypothetical protein